MDPTLILAAAQAALGAGQMITGAGRAKRLMQQRTAYKTPEEYFKILQATQSMASSGFDAFTLNYLTNQTDRAFSQQLGVAERLGANPNDLSALFDQKLQGVMKIGAQNHALNMANIEKFFTAMDVIGQNKAAEWKSQQDIIKDQLQSAAEDKKAGLQNMFGSFNAAISSWASDKTMDLYNEKKEKKAADQSGGTYSPTYDDYRRSN